MRKIHALIAIILGVMLFTSCDKDNQEDLGVVIVNESSTSTVKVAVWQGNNVIQTSNLNTLGDKTVVDPQSATGINVNCSKPEDCKYSFNGWTHTKARMFIKGEDF